MIPFASSRAMKNTTHLLLLIRHTNSIQKTKQSSQRMYVSIYMYCRVLGSSVFPFLVEKSSGTCQRNVRRGTPPLQIPQPIAKKNGFGHTLHTFECPLTKIFSHFVIENVKNLILNARIELTTFCVLSRRHNQLDQSSTYCGV